MIYIEAKYMSMQGRFLSSAAILVFTAVFCGAQSVAPAHSGTVHYFEGDVTVDGIKLVTQVARFTEMKEQSVLQTGMGRAEILLTPGVLLRVGENSSIKMLDNRLLSTRIEFQSGIAMLESVDGEATVKDPAVTIIYKDFQAQPLKFGVFEMTSQPSQVRVFKGEAKVTGNDTSVVLKEGNEIGLSTTMATAKFDAKEGDDLYVWSRDRSAYLSAGNMSSAQTLAASGYGSNSLGTGNLSGFGNSYAYAGWDPSMWTGFSGGWYYNSYLGMYSYLPFAGTMYSPFGYGFYNPMTIGYVYMPAYYWQGAGGARTASTTGVSLSTLPSTSLTRTGALPQLPRLTTASARPSMTAPLGSSATPSTGLGSLGSATSAASSAGSRSVTSARAGSAKH
jgi:hypothetical protein